MDTITTIQNLMKSNGSAQPVTVALTPNEAHLIAAAPDLLAALETYAKDDPFGNGYRPNRRSQQKKWDRAVDARAAIAKARNQ